MPYLGDYIGHLLAEMTIARMQADLETVRVAELYASHPLLKTMPVPHFRMPDIDLDLPVVIKQVEEPPGGASPRGGIPLGEMRKAFDEVLKRRLASEAVELPPATMKRVQAALDDRISSLGQPRETSVDVNRVADDLAGAVTRALGTGGPRGGALDPERLTRLAASLKAEARVELLKLRKPPPRLNVLVTTQEIREAGPSETITRIRLKLTEQGVEWTSVESEGGAQDRLVPE